jgi:hypothetical protein
MFQKVYFLILKIAAVDLRMFTQRRTELKFKRKILLFQRKILCQVILTQRMH